MTRLAAISFGALGATACAQPVVDMRLDFAANDTTDTSCVTAVEVRAIGTRYAQDPSDFKASCVELTGATYAALDTAMHDRYTVTIPSDGLAGIEVRAWNGPSACDPTSFQPFFTPDLIFYASGNYIGQDTIELPVTQNLGCSRGMLNVHVTDMLQLVAGAAPTDANCTLAMKVSDGTDANGPGVDQGSLVAEPFASGAQFYGGFAGAPWTTDKASFMAYTQAGPHSCLALDGGNDTGGSTSCQIANPVCGPTGDAELAAISTDVNGAAMALRPDLNAQFPGILFGSVWANGSPKKPVAGATVTVDAKAGTVVYIDPPAAGSSTPIVRTDQSGTGPTGMFLLYTNTVAPVTVKGGGLTRTVTLAATATSNAGALILLQ